MLCARVGSLRGMEIVNEHQAEAWNGYEGQHWADNSDRYDRMLDDSTGLLFEVAAIERAHRVLDIGCGAGRTTRIAARRAAHVLGVDLSAPMLERARAAAAGEGLANVTFEQGDAQVHALPTAHFDVAISRGGIMYFADPVAAFGNIGGALKPGGRLVFGCGRDGENVLDVVWAAMGAHVPLPDPAEDTAPGPVNFTDGDRIREVLVAAGFHDVVLREAASDFVLGSDADDAVDFVFGMGPVRFWLRDADSGAVGKAREAVATALRPLEGPGGVKGSVPGWVVSAVWRP
ncbi:Methyltransferase domain-containing protein [Saccharopolyspora antimicrobica]|uniref:Methyltransferase domain-containing protein n=2 Tax=Saccharopolyspora antimicrobica TaxID=455193 RepID=A0A1I5EI72_9PSEU|nr:methyltransferase family protein [Saccharopolyspora antimicrobica]SFO11194.1 Methyltransferase domain-containing protein [Saccharopolyspora antimicrobica]